MSTSKCIKWQDFLQQLHDIAGFLPSSSLCIKGTISAGCVDGEVLTAGRKLPWSCKEWLPRFPGNPCPIGMRYKPVARGGKRDKSTGLGWGSLAVTWSVEQEGTVKAMEPSTPPPCVLPARVGKACQVCWEKQPCGWLWGKGTWPTCRAQIQKDASIMVSEQERLSLLSMSLFEASREWMLWLYVRWVHFHSQTKGSHGVPAQLCLHGPCWRPQILILCDAFCILKLGVSSNCYILLFQTPGLRGLGSRI